MPDWDDKLPIYQQLADRLAARLLDGEPAEGHAMPSVRTLASQFLLNPLTVNRALQALADAGPGGGAPRPGPVRRARRAPAAQGRASASVSCTTNGRACANACAGWTSPPNNWSGRKPDE